MGKNDEEQEKKDWWKDSSSESSSEGDSDEDGLSASEDSAPEVVRPKREKRVSLAVRFRNVVSKPWSSCLRNALRRRKRR